MNLSQEDFLGYLTLIVFVGGICTTLGLMAYDCKKKEKKS